MASQSIHLRVQRVAEQVLADQHYVTPIDILTGLGWLAPANVDRWRQGRVPYLERVVDAGLGKVSTAMTEFRRWAKARGLNPSETAYLARTRDRRQLRFSASSDPHIERAYRTHWVSPKLAEDKRQRLEAEQNKPPDLLVISARNPWTCVECGGDFGSGALLLMEGEGPHCLDCFGLGHLEYVAAGNAALTRRTRKLAQTSVVVVRWSRTRKRYEREGIVADKQAVEQAEEECLSEDEVRLRRSLRED
jgi:predicted  nucleic acid-binding Zn-ribbon protein